jgi:hypothetical protein
MAWAWLVVSEAWPSSGIISLAVAPSSARRVA